MTEGQSDKQYALMVGCPQKNKTVVVAQFYSGSIVLCYVLLVL